MYGIGQKMIRIANLIFFMVSAYLVAARPGFGDMTTRRCRMIQNNCFSDLMSADFNSAEGIQRLCSTNGPRFTSCIENVPEECRVSVSGPQVDMMRSQLDNLCGAGCGISALMPCIAILPEDTSDAALCSIKDQFLACDGNLPAACATDQNYIHGLAPIREKIVTDC